MPAGFAPDTDRTRRQAVGARCNSHAGAGHISVRRCLQHCRRVAAARALLADSAVAGELCWGGPLLMNHNTRCMGGAAGPLPVAQSEDGRWAQSSPLQSKVSSSEKRRRGYFFLPL